MLFPGLGPLGILAGNLDGAVGVVGEGVRHGEFLRHLDADADAFFVNGEDLECGGNPPGADLIVDLGAVFCVETIDVFLRKIDPAVVEGLEVGVEGALGHLVVERLAEEVFFLQHADDAEAEVAVLGLLLSEEGGGGGGGEKGHQGRKEGRKKFRGDHGAEESVGVVTGGSPSQTTGQMGKLH